MPYADATYPFFCTLYSAPLLSKLSSSRLYALLRVPGATFRDSFGNVSFAHLHSSLREDLTAATEPSHPVVVTMADTPDIEECGYKLSPRQGLSLTVPAGMENANEALTISLVSPSSSGIKSVASFHPKFTYAIFGDEEKVFGYKDLKISLRFRANDMRPHLRTSYSKKLKPPAGVEEPIDVAAVLEEGGHLPKGWSPRRDQVSWFSLTRPSCLCQRIRL